MVRYIFAGYAALCLDKPRISQCEIRADAIIHAMYDESKWVRVLHGCSCTWDTGRVHRHTVASTSNDLHIRCHCYVESSDMAAGHEGVSVRL